MAPRDLACGSGRDHLAQLKDPTPTVSTSMPETVHPVAPPTKHTVHVRQVAARAWAEMEQHGVVPTPRNFDLWFTSLDGSNPELGRRLSAILAADEPLTPAMLETLRAECMTPEVDVEAVAEGTEAIQSAAQDLLEQVAGSGSSLREYGRALSHWAVQLGQDRTVEGLTRAVATLAGETARASERNRTLEGQLAAATMRITRLKDSLAEVKQEATTDALTGLCNRKAFDVRLRKAASRARAEGNAVSLLLIDVDHFKRFNDTHGHQVGDLVLRLVGRLLGGNVKGRDTAARYGGEEFAVILAGADLRAAATVAGQIRAELDGKRLVNKGSGQGLGSVTVSVGVAQLRPGEHVTDLVSRADAALYRAKHLGRNQVCVEESRAPEGA